MPEPPKVLQNINSFLYNDWHVKPDFEKSRLWLSKGFPADANGPEGLAKGVPLGLTTSLGWPGLVKHPPETP